VIASFAARSLWRRAGNDPAGVRVRFGHGRRCDGGKDPTLVRVGIIQSNYAPWRGYFDFIASVDLFIFYDDVQYTKSDWRNRNRIKTSHGVRWISVPVRYRTLLKMVCETEIDYSRDWSSDHLNQFYEHYTAAPFLSDVARTLKAAFSKKSQTISELNILLARDVCSYLGVTTPTVLSSELGVAGSGTERLISILKKVGATHYLSGPAAQRYLDFDLFRKSGIRLEYKTYAYAEYPQQFGAFEPAVTILDLIANCGPGSRALIRSLKPDTVVI
jgi:hypothetical protein